MGKLVISSGNLDNNGTVVLSQGTIQAGQVYNKNTMEVISKGTITGTLENTNTLTIFNGIDSQGNTTSGTLTISNQFFQSGTITIKVKSQTVYGKISVTGSASLGGTFTTDYQGGPNDMKREDIPVITSAASVAPGFTNNKWTLGAFTYTADYRPKAFVLKAPAINGQGNLINPIQGKPVDEDVATFEDPDADLTADDYTAHITWGDGGETDGIVSGGSGSFTVKAETPYSYHDVGTYPVSVTVTDTISDVEADLDDGQANVSDAPLDPGASQSITPLEASAFSGEVGRFTDENPFSEVADFTASIDWGDGSSPSTGTISQPGGEGTVYLVSGSHTYQQRGPYTITISVQDVDGASTTVPGSATVTDAPLSPGTAGLTAVEGSDFSDVVGSFTDTNPYGLVGDLSVTIAWGDGNTSAGTITQPGGAGTAFVVSGSHTYLHEGSYPLQLAVVSAGGSTTDVNGTATVNDAPLTGQGMNLIAFQDEPFTYDIGRFTDGNPFGEVDEFSAGIDWGDGSPASAGTIGQPGGVGTDFVVSGSHTYDGPSGDYNVTITVLSEGGSSVVIHSLISVLSGQFMMGGGSSGSLRLSPTLEGDWDGHGLTPGSSPVPTGAGSGEEDVATALALARLSGRRGTALTDLVFAAS